MRDHTVGGDVSFLTVRCERSKLSEESEVWEEQGDVWEE